MLLKMFFTIFQLYILYISVLECACKNVQVDENLETNGNTIEITSQNREASSQSQQLQLVGLREQLNEVLAKLNEMSSLMTSQLPNSCSEMPARGDIQQILVPGYSQHPFKVLCTRGNGGLKGGWTTVMMRMDGSVDFYRCWEHYKHGFGNLTAEFFIGLDKLHHLTKEGDQELLIAMLDFDGEERYAKYDQFAIDSEEEAYRMIKLGKYSGDAGDDLSYHRGEKFSTRDRDNDPSADNCAEICRGAWWYSDCHNSNLMGTYNETQLDKGINWFEITSRNSSLKAVQMFIRTKPD